jgi:hypothetical protein
LGTLSEVKNDVAQPPSAAALGLLDRRSKTDLRNASASGGTQPRAAVPQKLRVAAHRTLSENAKNVQRCSIRSGPPRTALAQAGDTSLSKKTRKTFSFVQNVQPIAADPAEARGIAT